MIVDPERVYGRHCVQDLVLATTFAEADVVGMNEEGKGDLDHSYGRYPSPKLCLIRRDLVVERGWCTGATEAESLLRNWLRAGIRVYCAGTAQSLSALGDGAYLNLAAPLDAAARAASA
jgi:hypothetical protein